MPRFTYGADAVILALMGTAACGDKVLESEVGKQIYNIPKQILDKLQSNLVKSAQQDAERASDADDKAK